jgi:hypothetical protein
LRSDLLPGSRATCPDWCWRFCSACPWTTKVFLVSRMAEEWSRTRDNARSVPVGQTHTARVITAAAAIMIAVFITFVFTGQVDFAEFGIGLAAAMPPDGRPPSPTVKLRTNVQIRTLRCPKAAAAAAIRSL